MQQRPLGLLSALALLVTSSSAQLAACPQSNSEACSVETVNPPNYVCGSRGTFPRGEPPELQATCSASFESCRDSCLVQRGCVSFAFDSSKNACTQYGKSLRKNLFRARKGVEVGPQYYNRNCFRFQPCPTCDSNFNLVIGGTGSSDLDGVYAIPYKYSNDAAAYFVDTESRPVPDNPLYIDSEGRLRPYESNIASTKSAASASDLANGATQLYSTSSDSLNDSDVVTCEFDHDQLKCSNSNGPLNSYLDTSRSSNSFNVYVAQSATSIDPQQYTPVELVIECASDARKTIDARLYADEYAY